MSQRAVDWTGLRPLAEGSTGEGLRERKKRLTRRQLSDTATEMFLERGFDAVRVAEIAEACGVSEKTVFNYFPTKESLLLDLDEAIEDALRSTLADPGLTPVQAVLKILAEQLAMVTSWLGAQDDRPHAVEQFRRFGALIRSTPSLRAHQRDATERLIAAAAEILAHRTGMHPYDPEPQIAATALLGLWPVQFQALGRYLDDARTPQQLHTAVTAHVARAATVVETGLGSCFTPAAD
ncbi:TetR/AcrR family transcriptional regulator [Streptacidiphilus sp. MAP5-3]|uniref:TetR/AcrR family transcriptional regulator n=1 Tax=unclassified Streptacidiphilus TaxID=2643834 RepID=UPI003515F9D5